MRRTSPKTATYFMPPKAEGRGVSTGRRRDARRERRGGGGRLPAFSTISSISRWRRSLMCVFPCAPGVLWSDSTPRRHAHGEDAIVGIIL